MTEINPVADLSYKNYDGPLRPPVARWWIIARQTIRATKGNKWLWIMSGLAGAYYAIIVIFLFVMQRLLEANPNGAGFQKVLLGNIQWAEQFGHGIGFAMLPSMIVAITVGAGAIANDNRANALLVYLSKPCTKFDYAFGKWVGVFLTLLGALALPALAFYAYGALSFRDQGFLKQDPYLLPHLLVTLLFCAALNASLILAISSLFKQGRLAGAVYAGIYFLGDFFTKIMGAVWVLAGGDNPARGLVKSLYYCSIDGLQIGLSRALLHTRGTNLLGLPASGRVRVAPPPPEIVPMLAVVLLVIVASLGVAWSRVRAVEVVG